MISISLLANMTRSAQRYRLLLAWSPRAPHFRTFASDSSTSNEDTAIILYERNAERNMIPRVAFGMSMLNTAYWLWYALDFIPAVNASPYPDMHIDPAVGAGGVALGALINSVIGLYPTSTISKLSYSPMKQTWSVHKHSLPLVRPSSKPTEYSLGMVTLDRTSSEVKKILENGADLSTYQGHLGISIEGERIPSLLEIREPKEVKNADFLLQALLDPQAIEREAAQRYSKKKRQGKGKRRKPKR